MTCRKHVYPAPESAIRMFSPKTAVAKHDLALIDIVMEEGSSEVRQIPLCAEIFVRNAGQASPKSSRYSNRSPAKFLKTMWPSSDASRYSGNSGTFPPPPDRSTANFGTA